MTLTIDNTGLAANGEFRKQAISPVSVDYFALVYALQSVGTIQYDTAIKQDHHAYSEDLFQERFEVFLGFGFIGFGQSRKRRRRATVGWNASRNLAIGDTLNWQSCAWYARFAFH